MTKTADQPATTERLKADRDRFVALAFCWADTLVELDPDNTITFAAGLTIPATGLPPDRLIGRHIDALLVPAHRGLIRRLISGAGSCGRIDNISVDFIGPGGAGAPVQLAAHKLPELGDQSFLAMRLGGNQNAVTDRSGRTLHDGLLDADGFTRLAKSRLAAPDGRRLQRLTLLSVPELTQMKEKLDDATYRNLLNAIGGYLKANSADRDSAARLSDSGFGLIHDSDLEIENLEDHLLAIVNGLDPTGVGASIESASLVANTELTEETLSQVMVYAIKQFSDSNRTGFTLQKLRENLPSVAEDAAEMADTFRRLISTKEFYIAFQPMVSTQSGQIHCYEALARISGRDAVSPYKYVCFAEETGQISDFDLAMAEKAARWLQNRTDPRTRVSVNISGQSTTSPDFTADLHKLLDRHPASRERLQFEITDSSAIDDLEAANRFVQSLRKRGHAVGLDDFGSGANGFHLLSTIEVDFVKVDGATIRHAQQAIQGRAFLAALGTFCRMLDIDVVASAIETDQMLAFVTECGVGFVQGYLFGKPSRELRRFEELRIEIPKRRIVA
ncbi:MAG: EAL domain-containing protein [Inquilinus sp.]|nr:EAL domain-containing protein [Inquilinus sp.]